MQGRDHLKSSKPAFDAARSKELQGNSAFTFSFLEGLSTGPRVPTSGATLRPVRVSDLRAFVETYFDGNDPNSLGNQLRRELHWPYLQKPVVYPARDSNPDPILRTVRVGR